MIKTLLLISIVLNIYLMLDKRIQARKKLGNLKERQALIEELTRSQFENHDFIINKNRMEKLIDQLLNERDHMHLLINDLERKIREKEEENDLMGLELSKAINIVKSNNLGYKLKGDHNE